MKLKSALQLVLALAVLPFCSNIMAAQVSIMADGGSIPEFAWLLGAVVLSFSVVARRSTRPPIDTSPTLNTNIQASNPELLLPEVA